MTTTPTPARPLHRLVAVTVAAASAVSVASVVQSLSTEGGTRPALAVALFAVGLLAELFRSRRRVGVHGWNWSASDAAITFALASAPGDPAVLGIALGIATAHIGRIPAVKATFNLAQNTLSLVLAATITGTLAALGVPVPVAAGLGYLAFLAANTSLVAAAVAISAGTQYRDVVRDHAARVLVSGTAAAVLGLVAATVRDAPAVAALVLVPLFSEHVAVRSHVAVAHRRLAVEATQVALRHRDRVEDAVHAALSAVASHFAVDRARLVHRVGEVDTTHELLPSGEVLRSLGRPDGADASGWACAGDGTFEVSIHLAPDGPVLDRHDRQLLRELVDVIATGVDAARATQDHDTALRELRAIANDRLDLRAELGSISRGLAAVERFVRRHWRGSLEDAVRVTVDLRAMREQADLAVLDGPRDEPAGAPDATAESWRAISA